MNLQLKEKHLKEIKSLEQEYKRNLSNLKIIQEDQSCISARIQILTNKLIKAN